MRLSMEPMALRQSWNEAKQPPGNRITPGLTRFRPSTTSGLQPKSVFPGFREKGVRKHFTRCYKQTEYRQAFIFQIFKRRTIDPSIPRKLTKRQDCNRFLPECIHSGGIKTYFCMNRTVANIFEPASPMIGLAAAQKFTALCYPAHAFRFEV